MDKKELKKKVVSTMLAGSLIFGTGVGLNTKAKAYNLNEPTVTLSEYNDYTGVKIFINGRLVEFNDDLGYPYIDKEKGRTMIPLRAVAETFGASVEYFNRTVYVSKQDESANLKIGTNVINFTDKNNQTSNVTMDVQAVIKNDRTYIPLRSLFECFGLNVRWDAKKRIAHIESNGVFENIDFKEYNVIDINSLDTSKVNKIMYDGVEIEEDYVNILKNSNQYKVVLDKETAYIFSYQYLINLNYIYGKEKECFNNFLLNPETKGLTRMNYLSLDELYFLDQLCDIHLNELRLGYDVHTTDLGYCYEIRIGVYPNKEILSINKAKEIAEKIKKQTSDKVEQIRMANDTICEMAYYSLDASGGAYDIFFDGKGYCKSYEHAFEYLMEELGIPCVNMHGYTGDCAHTWSHVYVNGEWKIMDVTNNDVLKNSHFLIDVNKENNLYLYPNEKMKDDTDLVKLTYKFNK